MDSRRAARMFWQGWAGALVLLAAAATAAGQTQAVAAEASPGKALGARTAPITMEVYSDYQCPGCRVLYVSTLRPLIDNYVASGKVYLIHRDFPLERTHPFARLAARYANAAARIGRFEKVCDALYARQETWATDGNVDAAVALVLSPAEMKRVRQLVQTGNVDTDIDQDVRRGGTIPVRQTPTVIVTHRGQSYPLPTGGISYSLLRQLLDELLKK